MESKIINQQKNPFLQREEIIFEIKSEAAPSIEEIKKTVGKDENLVVVKKVNSNFGTQTFTAEVFVYDSIEARKKIETIPKKIRKKIAEEEKAKAETEEKVKQDSDKVSGDDTKSEDDKTSEQSPLNEPEQKEETKPEEKQE